jgi:hypothetical protein
MQNYFPLNCKSYYKTQLLVCSTTPYEEYPVGYLVCRVSKKISYHGKVQKISSVHCSSCLQHVWMQWHVLSSTALSSCVLMVAHSAMLRSLRWRAAFVLICNIDHEVMEPHSSDIFTASWYSSVLIAGVGAHLKGESWPSRGIRL